MLNADIIGTLAACLTTASFLPQAVKVLQTRQTEGISLAMYTMFCLGVALWLVYGLLASAMPVILANAVTLVLASGILAMKLKAVFGRTYTARATLSQ
ncbi:MAG: SemiSWEET transporter [Pseudomonadota bacterium]